MKRILFVGMMFFIINTTHAQNRLFVEDLSLPQDGQVALTVQYQFEEADAYAGCQFEVVLPEGITFVTNNQGNALYTSGDCYEGIPNVGGNLMDGVESFSSFGSYDVYIKGTTGTLVTFTIKMDSTLPVGQELTGTIRNIVIGSRNEVSTNLDNAVFTITIDEPIDTHIVLDENATTVPAEQTNVDVRVRRTIKAGEWSTICLPFDMTEAQVTEAFGSDVELGDFTGAESQFDEEDNVVGITASFDNVTAVEANHPYIIRVSQPIEEFTLDGVDIVPDEDEAYIEFDNGKSGSRRVVYSGFYGTYHAETVLDEYTVFLNAGKYWYSKGLTKMKAFRAYFAFLDVLTAVEEGSSSARVSIRFNGDAPTGIQHIATEEQESDGATYDLQGRRVVKPGKGLYIRGGKVIVNK